MSIVSGRWLLSLLLPFLRLAVIKLPNYLLVIADQSQVESALAQRDTGKALLDQTADQKKAGLAAAVEVQSDVELQAREQKLIVRGTI